MLAEVSPQTLGDVSSTAVSRCSDENCCSRPIGLLCYHGLVDIEYRYV